ASTSLVASLIVLPVLIRLVGRPGAQEAGDISVPVALPSFRDRCSREPAFETIGDPVVDA
ncbi:MAG: hypothetical protein ACE5JN_13925, partial [Candidatus Methylomirabilia bacterium]